MTRTSRLLCRSVLVAGLVAPAAGAAQGRLPSPSSAVTPAGPVRVGLRPNIVFILIDDLGWNDLGITGAKARSARLYETPAIDQLAADGMRFTNAHASHPRCAPSRYSIMTGRYPARGQVPGGARQEIVKAADYTVAEALRDGGYATFIAGKWHLGKAPAAQPLAQGFDGNVGGGSAGATTSHFFPYGGRPGRALGPGLETGKPGEYLADRLTDETIGFIGAQHRRRPDQPFMVYLSHYGVHTPLEARPEVVAKFRAKLATLGGVRADGYLRKDGQTKKYQDNAVYAAMLASIDDSVGRIRAELKRLDIADNTLIVFTSDNGGLSNRGDRGRREDSTSNLPLRAGKGHLYEGGTTIPMIVAWPGHVRAGATTAEFTIGTDHYPSLLQAAGLPLRPQAHLDGFSYLPALTGGRMPADRTSYWYNPVPRTRQTGDRASGAIRIGDWKYYLSFDPGVPSALFDLKRDPSEQTDLSAAQPARVVDMKGKLTGWLASVAAVAPVVAGEDDRSGGQRRRGASGARDDRDPEDDVDQD